MEKTMKIEGMMCGHCEASVKKALEALAEVEAAEVSHEKGTAVVTLRSAVSDEVLKKAVEEHSVIGGLGSAVCDVLSEKAPTQVMKIGINDTYGESGPALELIAKYGLDTESIYQKIKAFV